MIAILDAARQMRLSEEAIGCVRPVASARAAVQALLDGGYQADALRLLARLLPRRYAVAWACQCGRRQPLNEHDLAGLALAEAWLREPAESQQGAALAFAKAHRYQTIGAWTAAAAGWSGGNLNPDHERPTPPPAHLSAIAASAAVAYMAALEPARFDARRTEFVRDALNLLSIPDGIDGGLQ
jgi:hypothetical protein